MIESVWIQRVYPPGDVFEFCLEDQELLHRDLVTEDRLDDVLRCLDAEGRGIRMPSGLKSCRATDAPEEIPSASSGGDVPGGARRYRDGPPRGGTGMRRPRTPVGGDEDGAGATPKGGPPAYLLASAEEVARRNSEHRGRW